MNETVARVSARFVTTHTTETFEASYDWQHAAMSIDLWPEFEAFAGDQLGLAAGELRQAVADATELLLPVLAGDAERMVAGDSFDVTTLDDSGRESRFRLEIAVADLDDGSLTW